MEPEQPAPQQIPPWLQKIYDQMGGGGGYQLTDDDLAILSQYMLGQQLQQGVGQMDLAQGNLDLQNRSLDLNEQELDQKYAEFEFQKNQYFPWYTGDYFDFVKQDSANKLQMSNNQVSMSNNQVAISDQDVSKSMNYAVAAKSQAEEAGYGADAARYQYLVSIGAVSDPRAPAQAGSDALVSQIYGY
jgi:hypothetical protein